MSAPRALGDTLLDVASAALVAAGATTLRATRVELNLPVQLRMRRAEGKLVLLADVPRTHLRSDLEPLIGRCRVICGELSS